MKLTLLAALLISTSAFGFNLLEPIVAWNKKTVKVCFATSADLAKTQLNDDLDAPAAPGKILDYTQDEKTTLKKIITREFTSKQTGIAFTGWKDCKVSPESDAYIFKLNTRDVRWIGKATLGQNGIQSKLGFAGERDARKSFVAFNLARMPEGVTTPSEDLELFMTHEFGHLAGLRHEHIDGPGEYEADPNCVTARIARLEDPHETTRKVSVYDANSIMNYCFLFVVKYFGTKISTPYNDTPARFTLEDPALIRATQKQTGIDYKIKIGLSLGDRHALKCLYSYNPTQQAKYCRASYNPRQ